MPPHVDLGGYLSGDSTSTSNDSVDAFPGQGGPSRNPNQILTQRLPRTVAEVKQFGKTHTQFEDLQLSDDFAFKLWCVLIPKALSENSDEKASASKFLIENREAFGDSLANDILLVTRVKDNGALDFGFAAAVKRALEYNEEELPALLFVREPHLDLYKSYQNESDVLKLSGHPLNGIALTLGGYSVATVKRFMEQIPRLLEHGEVPVDLLNKTLKSAQSAATRAEVVNSSKNAGKAAVEVVPTLLTIIAGLLKWTGHA
jgi:hypothetical protein